MAKPDEVLKTGYWTYDGKIRCRVEIQFAIMRPGSGDDQDSPEWRDDQTGSCFVVSSGLDYAEVLRAQVGLDDVGITKATTRAKLVCDNRRPLNQR